MTLYVLQTDDYEPSIYGVFSSIEKAEEVARLKTNRWDEKWIVTEYELDFFDDDKLYTNKYHCLNYTKSKKAKKWRA